jgi:hypothetical protein
MDAAAIALCEELAGAQFAFVQSDEISILMTDFDRYRHTVMVQRLPIED